MNTQDGLRMTRSEIIARTALGPQAVKAYRDPTERRNRDNMYRHECTSTSHACPLCQGDRAKGQVDPVNLHYLQNAERDFALTKVLTQEGRLFSSRARDLPAAMRSVQRLSASHLSDNSTGLDARYNQSQPKHYNLRDMSAKLPPHAISLANPYGSTSLWKDNMPPPVKTEYRTSYINPNWQVSQEVNTHDSLTAELERRSAAGGFLRGPHQYQQADVPTDREFRQQHKVVQPLNSFVPLSQQNQAVNWQDRDPLRQLDARAPRYVGQL